MFKTEWFDFSTSSLEIDRRVGLMSTCDYCCFAHSWLIHQYRLFRCIHGPQTWRKSITCHKKPPLFHPSFPPHFPPPHFPPPRPPPFGALTIKLSTYPILLTIYVPTVVNPYLSYIGTTAADASTYASRPFWSARSRPQCRSREAAPRPRWVGRVAMISRSVGSL